MADLTTVANILTHDYADKIIHVQYNKDIAIWKYLPIKDVEWSGDLAEVSLGVGFNDSTTSLEGNDEPDGDSMQYLRYHIRAKRIIGKATLTDEMIQAATAGGSIAEEPGAELDGLVFGFAKELCRQMFMGGPVIGLVWQKSNAITTYGYTGRSVDVVANANQTVQFLRLDTYDLVGAATAITAIDEKSITLAANIDTTGIASRIPLAVVMVGALSQLTQTTKVKLASNGTPAVLDPNGKKVGPFRSNMTGLFSNLCQQVNFGVDRSSASLDVDAFRLRSNFKVCGDTNAAGGDVWSQEEGNYIHAQIKKASGVAPSAWWMGVVTTAAFANTFASDSKQRIMPQQVIDKLDAGAPTPKTDSFETPYGIGRVPIFESDVCPEGAAFCLSYPAIGRYFRKNQDKSGRWVTIDGAKGGSPLIKTQGQTTYTAERLLYVDVAVRQPNQCGIVTGIAIPS